MQPGATSEARRVSRSDVGELRGVELTPQGGIRVGAFVTRIGVLEYPREDGTGVSRELRLPEEVFDAASLASMANATVTDLHPEDANGKPVVVNADNWRTYSIGHVEPGAKAADEEHVEAKLVIQDASAIARIKAGARREVSCGYTCELEQTAGEWNGQRYDAIHRKIKYNHVATGPVGWGRAGRDVALRLNGGAMAGKIKIDGIEYEFGSDAHIQAQQKWDSAREAQIRDLTKTAEDSKAALVAEQAARKKDAAEIPLQIKRRADMLSLHEQAYKLRGRKRDGDAAALAEPNALLEEIVKLVLGVDIAGKSAEEALGLIVKHSLTKQQGAANEIAPTGVEGEETNLVEVETPDQLPVQIAAGGATSDQLAYARMVERNRNAAFPRKVS